VNTGKGGKTQSTRLEQYLKELLVRNGERKIRLLRRCDWARFAWT